jgi:hypothetical protein
MVCIWQTHDKIKGIELRSNIIEFTSRHLCKKLFWEEIIERFISEMGRPKAANKENLLQFTIIELN